MVILIARWLLALFFVAAGANHFISPGAYLAIMPSYVPWPLAMVYLSGVAEIAGGLGALAPQVRLAAGWGLIALLIAIFPANIHMLLHHLPLAGKPVPDWALWVRLPFQGVFIAWIYWTCIRRHTNPLDFG